MQLLFPQCIWICGVLESYPGGLPFMEDQYAHSTTADL